MMVIDLSKLETKKVSFSRGSNLSCALSEDLPYFINAFHFRIAFSNDYMTMKENTKTTFVLREHENENYICPFHRKKTQRCIKLSSRTIT